MSVKKLGKNTIYYTVGTFLRYSVTFILIPIYTSALTISEYGALETLNVIVQSLLILMTFGLSNALMRYYVECKDEEEVSIMVRTATVMVFFLSIGFILISFPFFDLISSQLLKDEGQTSLIMLTFAWAIGGAFNELLFAYYRARQEAKTYTTISISFFILLVTLNISFVRYFGFGIEGILIGNSIAVWCVNSLLLTKFWNKLTISKYWMQTLLTFGLPLIFSRFGWLVLNSADRYYLAYFHDLEDVAIYGLGYKVGLIVQIAVIVPFQLAWGPFVFTKFTSDKNESVKDFSLIFTYLLFGFSLVGLFLVTFSQEIIYFLGTNKYPQAIQVVPFIVFAYFFNSIYYWAGNLLHLAKKTTLLSIIVFSMALLNLILNYLLVPKWGWLAAAIVTVISIGGAGILTLLASQRVIWVPLQKERIGKLFLNVIIISILFLFIAQTPELNGIIPRILIFLTFPLLIKITGFFTTEEINFVYSLPQYMKNLSNFATVKTERLPTDSGKPYDV